ncbi:putative E3 ubiquitin-protein ligase UBR7 [Brienomyrus brachyistius]|uniref:putative E3 ubiquitin-protein ligase UBR7 n=1 Tax=Brienomyrus brachyistius TaxID=42636 RepID=UPI0020B3E669|nr:putative E3 ubiquitin-protein ligase UBR7 [Brienomyrus brachyistius]
MALNGEEESTVSLVDVLEEDDELEDIAYAVLGASDPDKCSYPQGYVKRQALYACSTCTPKDAEPAGICLACSYKCHEGHDLFELYTKRNFRCDCGNAKFGGLECKLFPEKDKVNSNNKYNHNFFGLYCTCDRPYPDPEDQVPDEMIQCIVCEDWFHGRHLGCTLAECVELQEMVCEVCMNKAPFLWNYADHIAEPPVTKVSPSKEEVEVKVDDSDDKTEDSAGPHPSTSRGLEEKVPTDRLSGCKRTHEQMVEPPCSAAEQCKLERMKTQGVCRPRVGAVFWPYVWRSQLCTCISCKRAYVATGLPFLLDESDTVLAYENRGRLERGACDPLLTALNALNHVQQLEVIYEFNDMKAELKDYLQRFVEEGKVVAPEDIQQFFEELQSRKRRRTNVSQYYCS